MWFSTSFCLSSSLFSLIRDVLTQSQHLLNLLELRGASEVYRTECFNLGHAKITHYKLIFNQNVPQMIP